VRAIQFSRCCANQQSTLHKIAAAPQAQWLLFTISKHKSDFFMTASADAGPQISNPKF
jgi:hypothetical protein